MKAIVHRKRGPAWEFEFVGGRLRHVTRNGTTYEIALCDLMKPVWIARLAGGVAYTVEADIRATHIVFPNGGVYVFPGQDKGAE